MDVFEEDLFYIHIMPRLYSIFSNRFLNSNDFFILELGLQFALKKKTITKCQYNIFFSIFSMKKNCFLWNSKNFTKLKFVQFENSIIQKILNLLKEEENLEFKKKTMSLIKFIYEKKQGKKNLIKNLVIN